MDRHRGDRYGGTLNHPTSASYNQDSYHNRRPSRFSDAPVDVYSANGTNTSSNYERRSPSNYRGGGGHRVFSSPPRHPHSAGGAGGGRGFGQLGGGAPSDIGGIPPVGGGIPPVGGGIPPVGGGIPPVGGGGGVGSNYLAPPSLTPPSLTPHQPLSGQKRGYPFVGRGSSPDRFDGSRFAKLFVGSVPRTATEEDIRPLFEQHGNVIEVALIKDKRTGHQQGCCFVKYATSEEADGAIRALHNQHTLPGGIGPIQVRYADGERERLGAVEYKLFVGSLNKHATEKEVEEIFSPYGHVEDVYLMRDEMKQSRGCGFVKYLDREMALGAINALNGIYRMKGCDQPLTVRFADPKRPRPGDSRSGPAFGGPGYGPRFQAQGPRPATHVSDSMGDRGTPNAWHSITPNMRPSFSADVRGFGTQLLPRSGDLATPSNQGVALGGPSDSAPPGLVSTAQQNFNQQLQQVPPVSQQISPLQKPLQSPQLLTPLQLRPQVTSYSQAQTSHVGQLHSPLTAGQTPLSQALLSQQYLGLSGQLSVSQSQLQQGSSTGTPIPAPSNVNLQSHSLSNQQQMPVPVQQQLLQPLQQSASQLAQMLSQQTQTLQATFQSSQQAFSQLQQQLQMMQPSNQGLTLQQSSQPTKQQWLGIPPKAVASTPPTTLAADVPQSTSAAPVTHVLAQPVAPVKCNWTEHTSLEGFKYYYNSVIRESRWEKPEELTLFEQQPQQQQLQQKPPQQPQAQSNPQVLPTQQGSQAQQMRLQAQFQHHQQLQQPSFPSSYAASGVRVQQEAQELGYTQLPATTNSVNDPTGFQGLQAAQEWMWKNKAAGT